MGFLPNRTNRATYWLSIGVIAVTLLLISLLFPGDAQVSEALLVMLCIPRLHDLGCTGWLVLAPLLLEVGSMIATLTLLPLEEAKAVMGVVVLIIAGLVGLLGAIPGQILPNQFGDPPPRGLTWKRTRKEPEELT